MKKTNKRVHQFWVMTADHDEDWFIPASSLVSARPNAIIKITKATISATRSLHRSLRMFSLCCLLSRSCPAMLNSKTCDCSGSRSWTILTSALSARQYLVYRGRLHALDAIQLHSHRTRRSRLQLHQPRR